YIVSGFYTKDNIGDPSNPVNTLLGNNKPKPGDIMIKDLNGDGIINTDDITAGIGYPSIPEITFGLQLGFSFKNISFNTVWQGGAHVSRSLALPYHRPRAGKGPITKWIANHSWTPWR